MELTPSDSVLSGISEGASLVFPQARGQLGASSGPAQGQLGPGEGAGHAPLRLSSTTGFRKTLVNSDFLSSGPGGMYLAASHGFLKEVPTEG